MSTLHTLREAFEELERRADAAPAPALTPAPQRRRARFLAPAAAATAVAAAAVGVAFWQSGADRARTPAAGGGSPAPTSTAAAGASPSPARQSSAGRGVQTLLPSGRWQPPATSAQLADRMRSILGDLATITVVHDPVTDAGPGGLPVPSAPLPHLPVAPGRSTGESTPIPLPPVAVPNGAAIRGTLTSAVGSGGFDLNVYRAARGEKALCDSDTHCTVRTLPDGTSLAVGRWDNPQVPGAFTYQVQAVRRDGADVLLHLSTERDPKGAGPVTSRRLPLTVDQLVALVTSERW